MQPFRILLTFISMMIYVCHGRRHSKDDNHRRELGDNDHKHGPHFHDVNYHVHDPKDEAHMKKRKHWLETKDLPQWERDLDAKKRHIDYLRRQEKKDSRLVEWEKGEKRYSDDKEIKENSKKIVCFQYFNYIIYIGILNLF